MSVAFATGVGWLELVGTSCRYVLARVQAGDLVNGLYSSSDGFTVLTNGDFLVNDFDGDVGCQTYREYYGFNAPANLQGTVVPGVNPIDLSIYGLYNGTGVTLSPDGKSLYFVSGGGPSYETLVQTDLSGNLLGTQPINTNSLEGITVAPK